MILALGVVIGILLSILFALVALYTKPTVQRYISQTESALKPRGSIIEPENEDLESWVESLPQV